jgi:translation elongation factor EF-1beta
MSAKLVPLAYGIKKLTINCVIEDDKVSVDLLQEEIEKLEDYVSRKQNLDRFVFSVLFLSSHFQLAGPEH